MSSVIGEIITLIGSLGFIGIVLISLPFILAAAVRTCPSLFTSLFAREDPKKLLEELLSEKESYKRPSRDNKIRNNNFKSRRFNTFEKTDVDLDTIPVTSSIEPPTSETFRTTSESHDITCDIEISSENKSSETLNSEKIFVVDESVKEPLEVFSVESNTKSHLSNLSSCESNIPLTEINRAQPVDERSKKLVGDDAPNKKWSVIPTKDESLCNSLRSRIISITSSLDLAREEASMAKAICEKERIKNMELAATIRDLNSDFALKSASSLAQINSLLETKIDSESLRTENEKLKASLSETSSNFEELKTSYESLKDYFESLSADVKDRVEKLSSEHENEIEQIKIENIETLESLKISHEKYVDELKIEKMDVIRAKNEQIETLKVIKDENQLAIDKIITEHKAEVEAFRSELESLKSLNLEFSKKNEEYSLLIESLTNQNQNLQSNIERLENDQSDINSSLESSISDYESRIQSLIKKHDEALEIAQAQFGDSKSSIAAQKSQIENLIYEKSKFQAEIEALKVTVEDVKISSTLENQKLVENHHEDLLKTKAETEVVLKDLKIQLNTYIETVSGLEKQISDLKDETHGKDALIKTLESEGLSKVQIITDLECANVKLKDLEEQVTLHKSRLEAAENFNAQLQKDLEAQKMDSITKKNEQLDPTLLIAKDQELRKISEQLEQSERRMKVIESVSERKVKLLKEDLDKLSAERDNFKNLLERVECELDAQRLNAVQASKMTDEIIGLSR